MAEFASKGIAGTALGLGISGTALSLLNNGGNGVLGNLFGNNNNNVVSQLQAENAMLKAENSCEVKAKEVYMQSLADNNNLRNELYAFIKPLTDEASSNRERVAVLESQVKCGQEKAELREQVLVGKINEVALVTKGKFDCLDQVIKGISDTLYSVAVPTIRNSSVYPGWGETCTHILPCPPTTSTQQSYSK